MHLSRHFGERKAMVLSNGFLGGNVQKRMQLVRDREWLHWSSRHSMTQGQPVRISTVVLIPKVVTSLSPSRMT